MKISMDAQIANQGIEQGTTAYKTSTLSKEESVKGYTLDISGNVKDNNAYGGQGKTTEDVMREATGTDVAAQKNYMVVMSNSMSQEDFAKLAEDGFNPNDMEIETAVTIVDRIKATLLQSGVNIVGYTDDLGKEQLTEITGSEAYAQAVTDSFAKHDVPLTEENVNAVMEEVDKASSITQLSDGAKKYMVSGQTELTVDNLYRASYSTAKDGDAQGRGYFAEDLQGYYAKKADNIDFSALQGQMEKVIQSAGMEVTDATLEESKWLIQKGIPLTRENLSQLDQIQNISFPLAAEDVIESAACVMAEGKPAGNAVPGTTTDIYQKASALVGLTASISEEAVEAVVETNQPLTLQNLATAQKKIETGTVTAEKTSFSASKAKRQLEEVRLQMSVEANVRLLKTGFSIDTTELEQLVERLKEQETADSQALFPQDEKTVAERKTVLWNETLYKTGQIRVIPAAVTGEAVGADADAWTLDYVYQKGTALKATYEAAGQTYEALMTVPRSDLGDSIKQAFRSVDGILNDLSRETSEENQRTVRIMAYNSMAMTQENFNKVREADEKLTEVVTKLTPGNAWKMIRDNKNPLTMSIDELNDYLDGMPTETEKTEKYSKFLYKLEQTEGISQDEKDAFIGIYRLFGQIEKNDAAAVGSVIGIGQELTVNNLLSAVRTRKAGHINVGISDEFGALSDTLEKGTSISRQLENYFSKIENTQPVTAEQEEKTEQAYQKEQLNQFRQVSQVSEKSIQMLLEYNQPVTVDSLMAADFLTRNKGATFRKIGEYTNKSNGEKLTESISHLQESFTSKESAQTAYEETVKTARETLEIETLGTVGETGEEIGTVETPRYVDVCSMVNLHKQLSLAASLAFEENYEVPVQTEEGITSVNVRILHSQGETGKVSASMQDAIYGSMEAEFQIRGSRIDGYISSSVRAGTELLFSKMEDFQTELEKITGLPAEVSVILRSAEGSQAGIKAGIKPGNTRVQTIDQNNDVSQAGEVSTNDLYQIAKTFITMMAGSHTT